MDEHFDASTYGRSFADVYDDWYPSDDATDDAVERLDALVGAGPGDVLELGVGTGRLALPLAARGHRVQGIDSSEEMLDLLGAKQRDNEPQVEVHLGDLASAERWPDGPFDLVVAAFNMVFNLTGDGDARALFDAASTSLRDGGRFVVECFVPARFDDADRRLELRSVELDRVVLIATTADPVTSIVTGQHIELRDGQPVRLRPWRIRVAVPAELDALADAAGLELESRHADWSGTPFDADSAAHVSVYRRPAAPEGSTVGRD